MNLCCRVNPIKECKECSGKFCPEHVYTADPIYSTRPVPSECFACYRVRVLEPLLSKPSGMNAKELFLEVRRLCPKGYININFQVQEGQPGLNPFTTQWSIYHEAYKASVGATAEQALESFASKIKGTKDPQIAPLQDVAF